MTPDLQLAGVEALLQSCLRELAGCRLSLQELAQRQRECTAAVQQCRLDVDALCGELEHVRLVHRTELVHVDLHHRQQAKLEAVGGKPPIGGLADLDRSGGRSRINPPTGGLNEQIRTGTDLLPGPADLSPIGGKLATSQTDAAKIMSVSVRQVQREYAENEVRKDFVPSEQVAIAKEIEALELSGRRGGDHGNQHTGGKRDNCPPCQKGKTRDLAAKRVGFPTGKTYERAKKAVEKAIPEVVKAMDDGEISINRAYQLSHLPKDFVPSEQVAIAKEIEALELSGRRGRPSEMVDICPPLPKGKTRDLAAKRVGGDRRSDSFKGDKCPPCSRGKTRDLAAELELGKRVGTHVDKCPPHQPRGKTRDLAAKRVGEGGER